MTIVPLLELLKTFSNSSIGTTSTGTLTVVERSSAINIEAPISSLGVLTMILDPHLIRQSISLFNISLVSCKVNPRLIKLSITYWYDLTSEELKESLIAIIYA